MEKDGQSVTFSALRRDVGFTARRHGVSRLLNGVFGVNVTDKHCVLRTFGLYLDGVVPEDTALYKIFQNGQRTKQVSEDLAERRAASRQRFTLRNAYI